MLFNSIEFLIFFPIIVTAYYACPHRYRWALLLAASYYFYAAWKLEYVVLIMISTGVDYFAGIQMGKQPERTQRTPYLILSLATNLGLLFAFKYFNFFNDSVRDLFNVFNIFYNVPAFDVLLPVGISFYTFQTLSYTIDVYRGRMEPERHLGVFALFVSFFPQLVAGPIERARRLLPQLHSEHRFREDQVVLGLRLMLWGLFKKVVIADRLAIYVNQVYNNPDAYAGLPLLVATYFFAFQIYCDFSGYSDIAIGAARVMGIRLMENFRQPYTAHSVSDFWRRWHISLTTWFRDYLYIPLGGNRVRPARWFMNIAIVFLVSGLWHGASWTFVFWGALHALFVLGGIWLGAAYAWGARRVTGRDEPPGIPAWISIFATFHLVTFGWIFFRANSLPDALLIIRNMTAMATEAPLAVMTAPWLDAAVSRPTLEMALSVALILTLEIVQWLERRAGRMERQFDTNPLWLRWAAYVALAAAIMNLGVAIETPFIYFQF
jgi:D-alanyl-lipoteichoic acid acyltransferase DltB (MBOAT superfamily)